MKFTERETLLIINALFVLKDQSINKKLHDVIINDLDGTPDPQEVRKLIDRFNNEAFD